MNLGLKDKVIVTGGGAGSIGSVTCKLLEEKGAEVIVADLKNGIDLSKPDKVKKFFKKLHNKYPSLYGYCSFVYGGGGESGLVNASPYEIKREINNTLLAAVYPIQEAVKWMKKTGGGHIVIVSSINSTLGLNEFAYDIAKGGLNRIGPDIATAYGKYNIYAITICLGTIIGTPSWKGTGSRRLSFAHANNG